MDLNATGSQVEEGSELRKMHIKVVQPELRSTHQKLMETKASSTISCLIELLPVMGGSCF